MFKVGDRVVYIRDLPWGVVCIITAVKGNNIYTIHSESGPYVNAIKNGSNLIRWPLNKFFTRLYSNEG